MRAEKVRYVRTKRVVIKKKSARFAVCVSFDFSLRLFYGAKIARVIVPDVSENANRRGRKPPSFQEIGIQRGRGRNVAQLPLRTLGMLCVALFWL